MTNGLSAIKHVVVLMFENRSFDHVFGALPGVEGVLDPGGKVKPSLFNVPDPTRQPWPDNVPVQPTGIGLQDQATLIPHDFNHDFCDGMMPDLFGPGTTGYTEGKPIHAPAFTYPETNSGFHFVAVLSAYESSASYPILLCRPFRSFHILPALPR